MTSTVTQSLFSTVYKDDYTDSDHYHRILFNGGRALQARELTQMQTIIQSEVARFARNIFKEGAAVNPGGPTVNDKYEFIKLDTSLNSLPANPDDLIGTIFTGATSNLRAEVLQVVPVEGSDPATLYVRYLGNADSDGTTTLRMTAGENITNGATTLTVQTTNTTVNPAVGRGVRVSNAAGDFWAVGHFVFAQPQSIIVSKYSDNYTGVVGFVVTEDVVTAEDKSALYDNQGDVPNTSAPGADRYRIRLTLVDQANVDSDQMFIFFVKIVNSRVVDQARGTDDYNKINELLALRTKEESGNYVVRPYRLKFNQDSDTSFLIADISEGTAYVNGYRTTRDFPTKIRIQKPNTTTTINNEVVAADYGNYIIANSLTGVPNVSVNEQWNIKNDSSYAGSIIGTARIRSVEEDGAFYNLYLFDIQMSGNNSFRSAKSIGADSANFANIELQNNQAVLIAANNNDLLFPLPTERPSSLSDISLQVQKRFTVVTDGSGNATLSSGLLSAGETWVDTNAWVLAVDSSGQNISSTATVTGSGTTTASITGTGAANSTIEVLAYVNVSAGTSRSKTLTETTVTTTIDSDGNGLKFIDLGKADIYDVSRIRQTDSDGADLTSSFRLDNGQRDNYYGVGRLILKGGFTTPSGNVFARFRYFDHGTGNFFAVNSYAIDYADIPSYTLADGTTVSLRDVIDFRPRIDDTGTNFSDASAKVNPLPKPTDLVQADVTYYLPRYDRLVINELGEISILQGTPDLNPRFPSVPDDALNLYDIRLNPNTISESDLELTLIENKRYTMSDIAQLEQRIDRLEETTTLNQLEVSAETLAVLDSAGLLRTKAGFLADNFSDHFFSQTAADDYRASIDPEERLLRPSIVGKSIRLVYDSDASTNTILKGDNVYIKYTEQPLIEQDFVSGTENINPFAVVTGTGEIRLSPASDNWRNTQFVSPRVIDGPPRLANFLGLLFGEWRWQWFGRTQTTTRRFAPGRGRGSTEPFVQTPIRRVVSTRTIRETIGNRVVDIALIPWIRSRKVYFRATGLKPYQRYFPFFDGVSVADWCREETFQRIANDSIDWGRRFPRATAHPQGSTNLISDANGVIEGSFFIPSTASLRFRTGAREFQLLDVSSGRSEDALSSARAVYTARGVLETRQRTIRSTRVIRTVNTRRREGNGPDEQRDPLAQSFFITNQNGVYLTKARVYFASKPDTGAGDDPSPVILQIRPTVNGYPSSTEVVPGSEVTLTPDQVSVVGTQTQAGVLSSPTDFEFEEPIFLNPFTEYCVVLLTDTTKYNVYVAETEQFILGTTERRVTRQPTLGSLFKSQNSTTWEPDQTKDLTFQLFHAQFDTAGGTVIMDNTDVPLAPLDVDPLLFDSGGQWVVVSHPNHGFDSGDTVTIYGLDSATTYAGVLGTSILGPRTVNRPDETGYRIFIDSAATSSIAVGGNLVEATENTLFDIVVPSIDTLIPESTTLDVNGKFTTGKSWAGSETRFVKDTVFNALNAQEENYANAPLMIINATNEQTQLGAGVRSATIQIPMQTTSADVSPVVDMQRASLTTFNNIIDKQDSADYTLTGFNVPLTYVAETQPTGGSHIAKHLTTPVTLAETAVGLKIILAANRPAASDFLVYYRTGGEGDILSDQTWTLLTEETSVPSDENPAIFREYRYLAGGDGGNLIPFTQYQLKIVFRSTSSSKVSTIKDLRVIAMAD